MPITPFHLGPGLLIKSILQGYFCLIIFAWAQILIDIQPILVILTGKGQLHGFSHTYIGATLIAIIAAYTGKWIYHWLVCFIENDFTIYQKKLFNVSEKLTTIICISSAFIGTFSHVLLDSIMHSDIQPFYPLGIENQVLLIMTVETLHKFCIYTGLAGTVIFFCIRLFKVLEPLSRKLF